MEDKPVPTYGACNSGKNLYSARAVAEREATKFEMRYGWVYEVYQCRQCNWFHLAKRKHRGEPVMSLKYLRKARKQHAR